MTPQSGTFVAPNIRLSHQLGEGGMGEVWVADHLTLERRVAVKLIRGLASRCPDAGKCTVQSPYCVPGSDADCAASRVCRQNQQCFKNNMVCSTKK